MDLKRLGLATAAVFVVDQILDFLIHQILLEDAYLATASLWRADEDMMSKMWIMAAVSLLWSGIFVYLFGKFRRRPGLGEGLNFGLCVGLFVAAPMAYGTYTVMPVPHSLALSWFVYGVLQIVVCGAVAALTYKPSE